MWSLFQHGAAPAGVDYCHAQSVIIFVCGELCPVPPLAIGSSAEAGGESEVLQSADKEKNRVGSSEETIYCFQEGWRDGKTDVLLPTSLYQGEAVGFVNNSHLPP